MKKALIFFAAVIILCIAGVNVTDYLIVNREKQLCIDEAAALCEGYGIKDCQVTVKNKTKDKYKGYILHIEAYGDFDDKDPAFMNLVFQIGCIDFEYTIAFGDYADYPVFMEFECVFNGKNYEYGDGVLYCNGTAVQYKDFESEMRETYEYKEPVEGMPKTGLAYISYGNPDEVLKNPQRYIWNIGGKKYTVYISEDEKDFGGTKDYYVTKIEEGKCDVPYVGMFESSIGETELGEPSENVRHNYETVNGEVFLANLYDFYRDGAKVFTARCVDKWVTEVWDYRDAPITTRQPGTRKPVTTDDDPYNAKDYYHAEDFYYDHYDDFFDYYDAEDYFNEHHD